MIQGTGSHVGKSVVTAALCRYFHQEGFRVAPFKAQNMSNNSFVTADGREMGRAQAFQAQACGVEPAVEMNPVLLKPSSENGSQVIVLGKPVGVMTAREYHRYQPSIVGVIHESLEKLSRDHDIVVIEGAGSPAEINLRRYDIVNMAVAKMASAPVVLVGDINLGGVFAWLVHCQHGRSKDGFGPCGSCWRHQLGRGLCLAGRHLGASHGRGTLHGASPADQQISRGYFIVEGGD